MKQYGEFVEKPIMLKVMVRKQKKMKAQLERGDANKKTDG